MGAGSPNLADGMERRGIIGGHVKRVGGSFGPDTIHRSIVQITHYWSILDIGSCVK